MLALESRHNVAKRELSKLRMQRRYIDRLRLQRAQVEADISLLKGIRYDRDKVQTSPDGESFSRGVIELMELETEIADRVVEYEMTLTEMVRRVHSLSRPEYADVLYKLYIEDKTLMQAAEEIGYSYEAMCRIHGRALEEYRIKYIGQ